VKRDTVILRGEASVRAFPGSSKGQGFSGALSAFTAVALSALLLFAPSALAQGMIRPPSDGGKEAPALDLLLTGSVTPEGDRRVGGENPPRSLDRLENFEGCWTAEMYIDFPPKSGHYFSSLCFDRSGRSRSYSSGVLDAGGAFIECHYESNVRIRRGGFVVRKTITNCPGWSSSESSECRLRAPGVISCDYDVLGLKGSIDMYYQGMTLPERRPPAGNR
jgi:hypothetical protein